MKYSVTDMELKEYIETNLNSTSIDEAISSRRNSVGFPNKPNKEEILDWFDRMGYVEVPNTGLSGGDELDDCYKKTGNKCYLLGLYESDGSSWIMAYDSINMYIIRTVKGTENLRNMNGNVILYGANQCDHPTAVTYKEVKEEIEKNARS